MTEPKKTIREFVKIIKSSLILAKKERYHCYANVFLRYASLYFKDPVIQNLRVYNFFIKAVGKDKIHLKYCWFFSDFSIWEDSEKEIIIKIDPKFMNEFIEQHRHNIKYWDTHKDEDRGYTIIVTPCFETRTVWSLREEIFFNGVILIEFKINQFVVFKFVISSNNPSEEGTVEFSLFYWECNPIEKQIKRLDEQGKALDQISLKQVDLIQEFLKRYGDEIKSLPDLRAVLEARLKDE